MIERRDADDRCRHVARGFRAAVRRLVWVFLVLSGFLGAQSETDRFPPLSSGEMAALKEALRLEKENRFAEAARFLEGRLRELDHPALHFELGNLSLRLGNAEGAAAAYERALARAPDHPESLRNLARARIELGRPVEAVPPLTRALRHGRLSTDWMKRLAGIHLEERGDTEAAIAVYRQALPLSPGDADIREGIIVAELHSRDLDGAARAAEQALEVFPFHPRITVLLAETLVQKQDYGRAADLLEMLRMLERAGPRELRSLADLYHHEGLHAEAAAVYRDATAAGQQDPETRLRLAASLELSGQGSAAAEILEALLAENPENGLAWLRLGRIRQTGGRTEEAERAFGQAERLLRDSGEAHLGLAAIRFARGRLAEAEAAYLDAARDPATAARAWKGLGAVAARQGNLELAVRNYRHALALDPDDREVHRMLGRLERRR